MSTPTTTPTNPPSEQELTQYVIDKLGGFGNSDDLVFDLCNLMGWDWDRAEIFIRAVRQQHFRRIALWQSPWILFFGVGVLILGLILTVGIGWALWDTYRSEMLTDPSIVMRAPRLVYAFFIGVTMIIGSSGGLWIFMSQVIRGQ